MTEKKYTVTLRKKTYEVVTSDYKSFDGSVTRVWTTYYNGRRMSLMTRGECNAFPKTLGREAQRLLATEQKTV